MERKDRAPAFSQVVKVTLERLVKRKVRIVWLLIAALLLSGVYSYWRSSTHATATMSLNYAQASRGLNPNSTQFSVYDIRSAEVVGQMLEYAGLTGTADVSDITDCITVEAQRTSGVQDEDNFISTTYNITFNDPRRLAGSRSARDMLSFLCKAYQEFFVVKYGDNQSILSMEAEGIGGDDSEEYYLQIEKLRLWSDQLYRYAVARYQEAQNFADSESGESFLTLQGRLENFQSYQLSALSSSVTSLKASRNPDKIVGILSYKDTMDRIQYAVHYRNYECCVNTITEIDPSMAPVLEIPIRESHATSYYLSRVKTGADLVFDRGLGYLEDAKRFEEVMRQSEQALDQMRGGVPNGQYEQLEAEIESARAALAELERQLRQLDASYVAYKSNGYLLFAQNTAYSWGAAALYGAVSMACMLVLILFAEATGGRHELRKKKQEAVQ